MRQDLTEIIFITDRSGSMASNKIETQNAINQMIKDQQGQEGECRLTLVEFDDKYDVVFNHINIDDVEPYTLNPRNMTALYDAVGSTIDNVGKRLSKTLEKDRPSLVTVVIATDGLDNCSRVYSRLKVADMIKNQRENFNWQFVFIGVEIDEKVGMELNIHADNVVSMKRRSTSKGYGYTSGKLKMARDAVVAGASAMEAGQILAYSDEEKKDLNS